jgi:hypothetical protein
VLYNDYEAKKTVPYDIAGTSFVLIYKDLISPLVTAPKRKRVRSAKESNNAVINIEKR